MVGKLREGVTDARSSDPKDVSMGKLRGIPNPKKRAAKVALHRAQVGKVACCHRHKQPKWFLTTEERNAHVTQEHR